MGETKKEVKLGTSEAKEQKLSYEKVTEIATQLHSQNHQLMNRVRELEMILNQTRLEYLFAVVKHSEKFPQDFVEMCVKEVVVALSPVEHTAEPDPKEEK